MAPDRKPRRQRLRLCTAAAAVGAAAGLWWMSHALVASRKCCQHGQSLKRSVHCTTQARIAAWFPRRCASVPSHSAVSLHAAGASESETWQEAYQLELERNRLLHVQLQSRGGRPELGAEDLGLGVPDTDWQGSYERLSQCNQLLEQQLSNGGRGGGKAFEDMRDVEAMQPALFKVRLPDAAGGAEESIELLRFFGRSAAMYAVQARLPLGLNLTKHSRGMLQGAFVVEGVLPGGSAAAGGEILPGDVLQALTVVMDNSDLGMKTEDFVSSVIGGFGRWRQRLTDATFIATLQDLVEAFESNNVFGSDVELTLVFERDTRVSPAPSDELRPVVADDELS